jgi:hypothetical protein
MAGEAEEAAGKTGQQVGAGRGGRRGRGGRGGGRGRGGRGNKVTNPGPKEATQSNVRRGRGGGKLLPPSTKVLAGNERMQQIKAMYNAIVKKQKPVLEELADRSLDKLRTNSMAYQQGPEFKQTLNFLQQRRDDAIKTLGLREDLRMATAKTRHQADIEVLTQSYAVSIQIIGYHSIPCLTDPLFRIA